MMSAFPVLLLLDEAAQQNTGRRIDYCQTVRRAHDQVINRPLIIGKWRISIILKPLDVNGGHSTSCLTKFDTVIVNRPVLVPLHEISEETFIQNFAILA